MSGSSRYRAIVRSSIRAGSSRPAATSRAIAADGVGDLGPAAVVDAHGQGQHVVVAGSLLGLLQLADHAAPQPRPPPGPADPHAQLVHLVAAPADDVAVEAHQEAHLVRASAASSRWRRRTPRGAGRRSRSRRATTSNSDGLAHLVALVRGSPRALAQRPLPSMTTATCRGHQLGRDRGRPGAGRVRRGCDRAAAAGVARRRRSRRRQARAGHRHRSTSRSERSPPLQVPLQVGRDQAAGLAPAARASLASATSQSPASSAREQRDGLRVPGAAEPGGRQLGQTAPPAATRERPVRAGLRRSGRSRRSSAPSRPTASDRSRNASSTRPGSCCPCGERAQRRRRAAGTAAGPAPARRRSAARRSPASRCRRCSGA